MPTACHKYLQRQNSSGGRHGTIKQKRKRFSIRRSFQQRTGWQEELPQLELTVRVINIGPEQTWKFQDGCDILKQYCDFIELVREYAVPGDSESYKKAIEEAIRKGILKNYLIKNSTEVINMFLAEYDYETDVAVQREEAREDKAIEAAVTLIQKYNEQPETAAQVMGAPLDKVLEALKED